MVERFAFIDALRGLAAMGVVLFHAVEGNHLTSLPGWARSVIEHGNLGVAVFFVLSGFVITHSLRDKQMTLREVGRFALRRSVRLDPPYWIAISVAIGFSLLAGAMVNGRTPDQFSIAQVGAHLAYLQDLLGYKNINPVFWTLCYEVQFYIVFALLLTTRSAKVIASAFFISLLWPIGLAPHLRGFFPNLWFGFLLGVGAYYAWTRHETLPWVLGYVSVIIAAATWHSNIFALACGLAALLIIFVARVGQMGAFGWRWLQGLGAISYSLYLLHNPITGATFRVGYNLTGRTPVTEMLWWGMSIAACIVAATALHILVERPALKFSRLIASGKPSQATALQ
jgi:peptidoglycan/LPS O-acetylase OafA/YrhL